MSRRAVYNKSGPLRVAVGDKQSPQTEYHVVLHGSEMAFFLDASQNMESPDEVINLKNCNITEHTKSPTKKYFTITTADAKVFHFFPPSSAEFDAWMEILLCATFPNTWPGGKVNKERPQPAVFRLDKVVPTGGQSIDQAQRKYADALVPQLPQVKAVPSWGAKQLVLQKLRLCSVVFTPDDPFPMTTEYRDRKRRTLLELIELVESSRHLTSDFRIIEDTFTMIRMNLFRTPPKAPPPMGDPDEEEETFMDPMWPHLSVVYELLLQLVTTDKIPVPTKKKVIDSSFVRNLLALFDSEDIRERDYLKTITHRVYSKLTQRRALIRRTISYIFFEFVYEIQQHNGIAETLEILASIINGFATPIKEEHKKMLERALIPLHKPASVVQYHAQLSYCMALYVSKDHELTRKIIPGLLKYWPVCNSSKQIMFLNELEDIFEYVQSDDLAVFAVPLAQRLASAIGGDHFQVAERTLCLWNSDRFVSLTLEEPQHRRVILPIIFSKLMLNSTDHWHENVKTLSHHILRHYREVDESLYERCELEAKERFSAETARQKNKELARQEVERMAAKRREELGLTTTTSNGRGGGGGGDSSFSGDVDMG